MMAMTAPTAPWWYSIIPAKTDITSCKFLQECAKLSLVSKSTAQEHKLEPLRGSLGDEGCKASICMGQKAVWLPMQ